MENEGTTDKVSESKEKPSRVGKTPRKVKREEKKARKKKQRLEWKQAKKNHRKTVRGRIWLFMKVCILLFLLAVLGAVGWVGWYFYDTYWDTAKTAYEASQEKVATLDESIFKDKGETVIYDKDGKVLANLATHQYRYLPYDKIPENAKLATIAIEDVRFLEHTGVDVKALGRAGYQLIKNNGEITQGGSTITQQLVKNSILTHEQTFSRKFEEIFISLELEKMIPKSKILEYYLNNIYFGRGAYGIESASNYYFSKSSKKLTLAEISFLMAIPNNPSLYDPIDKKENTLKRQNRILKKMYESEFITQKEFTDASLKPIKLKIKKRVIPPENNLVSFAISDATKQLMKANGFKMKSTFDTEEERKVYQEKYTEAFEKYNVDIRDGGYEIKTVLDQKMQKQAQEVVDNTTRYATAKDDKSGLYKRQAASVIIDNKTGQVNAIVGGRTQDGISNTFNRGFLAYRQPGSTIKPILAYTQAFERKYYPDSKVTDKELRNGPNNVNMRFTGSVTIEHAVIKSINTIPFQLIQEAGVKESLQYLKNMNFSKIVKTDEVPVAAIGGLTYGVTPLEMASAYSTLSRNGEYLEPTSIKSIHRTSGEQIYKFKVKPKRVYDAGASYLMTKVLQKVAHNKGSHGLSGQIPGYITATKTGTTNANKDVWMAGYSPYYTTVVWVGEDSPRPMSISSYDDPMVIWNKTMKKIHNGLPKVSKFDKPKDALFAGYVNPYNGRLSYTYKGGWRKELIPTSRMKKQEAEDHKAELARKKQEEEAAKKQRELEKKQALERKKQEEKIRKQEAKIDKYLKAQGSSLAEEKARIQEVEALLSDLQNYQVYNRGAFDSADLQIRTLDEAIDALMVVDNKEKYQKKLDTEIARIDDQKDQVERAIILQEDKAERDVLRAEEARVKEQERQRLAEQLERDRKAEASRIAGIKAEEARKKREADAKARAEEEAKQTESPDESSDTEDEETVPDEESKTDTEE